MNGLSRGGAREDTNEEEEAATITRILAGDLHRYHDLIRPYERRVYAMALTLVKNEADAEEVAQEAFLNAFRNLRNFRGESRFSTWLISITLNEARSRLRRNGIVPMNSIDTTAEEGGTVSPALLRDWREVPLEALERKEVRQMLEDAVQELPEIYREVFLLRDVEEFSIAETATALLLTMATVKVRLHRARIMLQKRLTPLLKNVNPKKRWLPWS